MTPNELWKIANRLEDIAKDMKGLALLARNKHASVNDVKLPVPGELFPVTIKSVYESLDNVHMSMK